MGPSSSGSDGEERCTDEDSQCVAWAKEGQCSSNPEYMRQNCKSSCSLCGSPVQTPSAPAGHGTQNGTVPAWCQFVPTPFQDVACRGPSRSCQCKDWCRSTSAASRQWNPECCGCSADLPSSLGSDGGVRCTDEDSQCIAWAKAGQCSANPAFMRRSCKSSCNLCGSPDQAPRPAEHHHVQNGTVPAWCQFVPTPFQGVACGGSN